MDFFNTKISANILGYNQLSKENQFLCVNETCQVNTPVYNIMMLGFIKNALKNMINGQVPGPNGLTIQHDRPMTYFWTS